MDASALASALDNLEKSWSSLDWWLDFWTVLVVVGVALELAILIAECAHEWRDFKRGEIHPPEKPSLIIFGLGFLGAGLVAIGVAGEFRVHVQAGKIETDMRDATRQLVALVNKDAEYARTDARLARKEASVADEHASDARKHAAELEVRAEQLHKENLELEISSSPRGFRDQLGAGQRLAKFAPVNAVIEYLPEIECKRTAGQIALPLLNFSKWNILAIRPNANESEFFDGVIVQVDTAGAFSDDINRAGEAADSLVAELNSTGIQARRHALDPKFPPGTIVIRVGMKPSPAQQRFTHEEMKRMGFPQEMIDRVFPPKKK